MGYSQYFLLVLFLLVPGVLGSIYYTSGVDPLDLKIESYAEKIRSRNKKPNIVFLVLESVGSLNLFNNAKPKRAKVPNIDKLLNHSIVFDNIYTSFPTTARSHVPMLTGGQTITWGSVFHEFNFDYTGDNLIDRISKIGYSPALFSSGNLAYENRYSFYGLFPYEEILGFNTLPKDTQDKLRISKWGVSEDYAWNQSLSWLDDHLGSEKQNKPFFLHFMTVSTHHPYNYPKDFEERYPSIQREDRYMNALHYTDEVIGRMISDLKKRNVYEDTIFIITGDHGQAFEKFHSGNLGHKKALYEQNIKTFLMVSDPKNIKETIFSNKISQIGDIMPTILATVEDEKYDIPAQNLFSSNYREKKVFFHKSANKQRWGLRDGKWKYTSDIRGSERMLFDLEKDPLEQHNIVFEHRRRADSYDLILPQWYLNTNKSFLNTLENHYQLGGRGLKTRDLKSNGPKILAFGIFDRPSKIFYERDTFTTGEKVTAWSQVVPYPVDHTLEYQWQSPRGEITSSFFKLRRGWSRVRHPMPPEVSLREGRWKLTIVDTISRQNLIEKHFHVEPENQKKLAKKTIPK